MINMLKQGLKINETLIRLLHLGCWRIHGVPMPNEARLTLFQEKITKSYLARAPQ